MPTIKVIDAIKILIYFRDHLPPHFHAVYNDQEALIEINTLRVYAGALPARHMKKVISWAAKNQDFLMRQWNAFNPNK